MITRISRAVGFSFSETAKQSTKIFKAVRPVEHRMVAGLKTEIENNQFFEPNNWAKIMVK